MTAAALYALDWGTTSARAYRIDAHGHVLDVRSAPLGIAQVHDGRFHDAMLRLMGDWQNEPAPRLACGMIGSRQGWVEAPYIACPAPLSDLAAGIVQAPEGDLGVVPGVRTRDANGIPDVMRGEETQIVGGVDEREARVLVALPGTHSKWAFVESGRIVDFATFMTGEVWNVLLTHSILGRLAVKPPPGAAGPPQGAGPPGGEAREARFGGEHRHGVGPGFARGVTRGLGAGNLVHDMFGARSLALMGELPGEEVADWLSGLMIGREVRNARTWAQRNGYDGARVRLIGDDNLVARYAQALAQADVAVERADSRAAAHGLWRIAVRAGLVNASRRKIDIP